MIWICVLQYWSFLSAKFFAGYTPTTSILGRSIAQTALASRNQLHWVIVWPISGIGLLADSEYLMSLLTNTDLMVWHHSLRSLSLLSALYDIANTVSSLNSRHTEVIRFVPAPLLAMKWSDQIPHSASTEWLLCSFQHRAIQALSLDLTTTAVIFFLSYVNEWGCTMRHSNDLDQHVSFCMPVRSWR
jgi:hypothetical protein